MDSSHNRWFVIGAFFFLLSLLALFLAFRVLPHPNQEAEPSPLASSFEDTQTMQARILRVISSDPATSVQKLELEIVSGPLRGERAEVEQGLYEPSSEAVIYRPGDQVLVDVAANDEGEHAFGILDFVRTDALALLAALFVGFTILVSGWKGIRSLIGLLFSFIVLVWFVLPRVLEGQDAVLVTVVGSFSLLAVTLYLTLGWSLKTHTALLSVLFTLLVIGLLSSFAISITRLNGGGSEDALMLLASGTQINLRGLLLAGMIIGTLGVLDDVVVTQVSTVMELAEANSTLSWRELYRRGMNIGRDHISATVNTLVLAYVGAAMPMLLLFQLYPEAWNVTINRGFVTEEIVRTLVGSLGLIAAVPITTLASSLLRYRQVSHSRATPSSEPESFASD